MWRSRSTRSAWCFACSVISAGAAPGRAGNSGRGRTGQARGDIVGRFGGNGADRPGVAALRSGHAGPLRPARTPARRGRCRVAAPRPCIPSRAALSTVGASAGRPCQRAGAGLRRADPLRGMETSPASASTNCAPCAMPACSPAGDVRRRRRSRRAEPRRGGQSRQGFRRTRGSPASAAACSE